MTLKKLLQMAGVADLPKAKKLIEREKKLLPVFYVSDQQLSIIKPGRYQGRSGDFIRAYRSKQQAIDNAINVGNRSDLIVYELDQSEFPYKHGDQLTTMYFIVPIRQYPI